MLRRAFITYIRPARRLALPKEHPRRVVAACGAVSIPQASSRAGSRSHMAKDAPVEELLARCARQRRDTPSLPTR